MNILQFIQVLLLITGLIFWVNNSIIKKRLVKEILKNEQAVILQRNNPVKVLYIRDFSKDTLEPPVKSFLSWKYYSLDTSFEIMLSNRISQFAHFIAIGKPGDEITIGADRLFFEDEVWKKEVLNLMEASSLILAQPNMTVGIVWEFNQLIEKNYLEKTILCLSLDENNKKNYEDFAFMLKDKITLPDTGYLNRFIYFDKKMNAHMCKEIDEVPLFRFLINYQNTQDDNILNKISEKTATWIIAVLLLIITLLVLYTRYAAA